MEWTVFKGFMNSKFVLQWHVKKKEKDEKSRIRSLWFVEFLVYLV